MCRSVCCTCLCGDVYCVPPKSFSSIVHPCSSGLGSQGGGLSAWLSAALAPEDHGASNYARWKFISSGFTGLGCGGLCSGFIAKCIIFPPLSKIFIYANLAREAAKFCMGNHPINSAAWKGSARCRGSAASQEVSSLFGGDPWGRKGSS